MLIHVALFSRFYTIDGPVVFLQVEALAFPHLFSTGMGDYSSLDPAHRPRAADYYKARLQQLDFRRDAAFIFFALVASAYRAIQAGIYACTRTKAGLGSL